MSEQNLKYTKEHEWVRVEGNIGVVGITAHAQDALGDITFIENPRIGTVFSQGEQTGTVESVKAVSEIYSPVSGEITEVNKTLENSPELVNQDPYVKGWLYKVKLKNKAEVDALLSYDEYQKLL
jgi:glycine cleavage system H protein